MAATTTPSISWLLPQLTKRYPEINFQPGEVCAWNPASQTIYYTADDQAVWQLLHEIGHALLDHRDYCRDIELLGLERDAWQQAERIAADIDLAIPDQIVQQHLDTYRDWLHARSSCVNCGQIGLQMAERRYSCPHCHTDWRVNDARRCTLRRYRLKPSKSNA